MKLNLKEDDLIGLTPNNSADLHLCYNRSTEPALPDKAINYSLDDDDSLPVVNNCSGGIDFWKTSRWLC